MSTPADGAPVIRAAGGAVWRRREDGVLETVLVHRPKYDDWSLPKGKLDPGEHPLGAAVREVLEETGLKAAAGRRSVQTRYDVQGLPKLVDYWVMAALGGQFVPNDEVDELRWLPLPAAVELCSQEHDRAVLADLARTDVPRAPTLLLIRHASAGDKDDFTGPDALRPLDARGRRQAARLADILPLFCPTAVLAAERTRCRETVAPLAQRLGLPLGTSPELGEEEFHAEPDAALAVVERLLAPRAEPGVTVICSQGGAIPSVLMVLGVRFDGAGAHPWPPSAKGSVWAIGGRPGALAADYYRNFAAPREASENPAGRDEARAV